MHGAEIFEGRKKGSEKSEQLRLLITSKYPSRGRFRLLEEASGISEHRWKNFFYRKQEAAQDMLDWWCKKYTIDAGWIQRGTKAPEQEGFPFAAKVPSKHSEETIADRLNWVISEWASPSGEQLFNYLEQRSQGRISASDWAKVILKTSEPTLEMVALVCEARPHFTEWVLLGKASVREIQVDPSDTESIRKWKENENETAKIIGMIMESMAAEQEKNEKE